MAPRLKVLISTSSQAYPPTQLLNVNSTEPTPFKTDKFEGEVNVWVKDFTGEGKKGDGDEYFNSEGRGHMTYSIVVRGRFLDEFNADEVYWGNLFEKPIRDSLPWGTSIAMKAMQFVDPNVKLDVYADKPWALSPTLATFNFLSLNKEKPKSEYTVTEDSLEKLWDMYEGEDAPPPEADSVNSKAEEKAARKKWLGYPEHRKKVKITKDTWVGMEFCNGYLDFNTLSARLPPPFTMSFPLLQYWDGQPVTYVCKRKAKEGEPETEGTFYFAVAFEIIDSEAKKKLAEKTGGSSSGASSDDEGEKKEEGGKKEESKLEDKMGKVAIDDDGVD